MFWRNNLNLRNEISQCEKHFFDSSNCEISKLAVKKIDFPQLSYSIIVLIPIGFVSNKRIFKLLLWRNLHLNIELKLFQNTFCKFRTINVLMDQSNYSIFFSCSPTQLWSYRCRICLTKNNPVLTDKFDCEKQDESIFIAITECFALSKFQFRGQKIWIFHFHPRLQS